MKTVLSILFLVAVTQASVLEVTPTKNTLLRRTRITELTTFSPDGITVRWIPVKIAAEPVVGYKVKLRMFEGEKVTNYEIVNGTEVEIEQKKKLQLHDVSLDSPHKLYEYSITGPEQIRLTIKGVKRDTPYMVEALPYSAKGDGPPSPVLGFQINKNNTVSFSSSTNVVIINRLP